MRGLRPSARPRPCRAPRGAALLDALPVSARAPPGKRDQEAEQREIAAKQKQEEERRREETERILKDQQRVIERKQQEMDGLREQLTNSAEENALLRAAAERPTPQPARTHARCESLKILNDGHGMPAAPQEIDQQ